MQALGLIAMAGGSALSAYSTIQGGKDAAEAGKIQQQQLNAEAKAEEMAGLEAGGLKRKEGREIQAQQIAQASVSGGLVGSNLVIMTETARNVEMDALTIGRNAGTKANALRMQGEWARYEGRMARWQSRIRATSDVLGTAGQSYLMYKSKKPGGGSTTTSGGLPKVGTVKPSTGATLAKY